MLYNKALLNINSSYLLLNIGDDNIQDRKKQSDIIKLESTIYIDGFNIIKLNSNVNNKWLLIQATDIDNNKLKEYGVKYMKLTNNDNIYIKLLNENCIHLMYSDSKCIPINITNYNTTDINKNSINIYNENYNFTLSVDKMYKIIESFDDIKEDSRLEYLTYDNKWVHYNLTSLDEDMETINKLIKYNKIRIII